MRSSENPNLRKQDGLKIDLLCKRCEERFQKNEDIFCRQVFNKYVEEELDEAGVARGVFTSFKYDEWLIRFLISLFWRILTVNVMKGLNLDAKRKKVFMAAHEEWRIFLLEKTASVSPIDLHMVFLQNFAAGRGTLPKEVHPQITTYCLRIVDATTFDSKKDYGIYCKIGPIALFLFFHPKRIEGQDDTRIRYSGNLKTAQKVDHQQIVKFLFITRPHEIFSRIAHSENQQKKIDADAKKKKGSENTLAAISQASDHFLNANRLEDGSILLE